MNDILKKMKMEEKGAVQVIEMTLIFPFVIIVIGFLIYLASYIMQIVWMYNDAQRIAVAATREAQMPGYEHFYEHGGIVTMTDFNWEDDYSPGKSVINSVMSEHDPYRYFGDNFLKEDNKVNLEDALKSAVTKGSFLTNKDVDCDIYLDNNILCQNVKVELTESIDAPAFLSNLGIDSVLEFKVTAVAVVSDSSEFIRNTDIVCDLAGYLWNDLKLGNSNETLSERFNKFRQSFKDTLNKLK